MKPEESRPVVVTRYPTGCLALEYEGNPFHWWCWEVDEMISKILDLGIDRVRVRWQERYYDGDYRIAANYKTRPWNP